MEDTAAHVHRASTETACIAEHLCASLPSAWCNLPATAALWQPRASVKHNIMCGQTLSSGVGPTILLQKIFKAHLEENTW